MVERRFDLAKDAVQAEQIAPSSVGREEVKKSFIQCGKTSVTFNFSATGVEAVTADVTFPEAFPSGVTPKVVITPAANHPISLAVTAVDNTKFTITAKDELCLLYTSPSPRDRG